MEVRGGAGGLRYYVISFLFLDPALVFVNSPFVKPAPKYYLRGQGPNNIQTLTIKELILAEETDL